MFPNRYFAARYFAVRYFPVGLYEALAEKFQGFIANVGRM